MIGRGRQLYKAIAGAILVIALASLCHHLALSVHHDFPDLLLNFIRTFLFLGLFFFWGISVGRRVIQPQVRRYMIMSAGLIILWICLREIRFRFIVGADGSRMLWYLYYIPMLFIPMLAVLEALSLGQSDTYRVPAVWRLLAIPTLTLIALVLTNDLHQLAFLFPDDVPVWNDDAYSYGPVYYLCAAWGICCGLLTIGIMLKRCRLPQGRGLLLLPFLPFAAIAAYTVLYALRFAPVRTIGWDLTIVYSLLFCAFLESCIQCGLIQSNTRHGDLFHACRGLGLVITDKEGMVRYAAADAVPLDRKTMDEAMNRSVILKDGSRLRGKTLTGGYVFWTEDVAVLEALREQLEDARDELTTRSSLLRHEYEEEQRHRTVEVQNRLYDLLQTQTQKQLDRIDHAVEAVGKMNDPGLIRDKLAEILILGTYIKRSRDLLLSADTSGRIVCDVLENAFAESCSVLRLIGIRAVCELGGAGKDLSSEAAHTAYAFFEQTVECLRRRPASLSVILQRSQGVLRLVLATDAAPDLEYLQASYPSMTVEREDDGLFIYFEPEGGASK